jgi:hypothetical protein
VKRVLRLTPADRERSPYVLVPFEVPAGAARLCATYGWSGPGTLDLGVVDPRGADFPSFPGFRGWSGSFRRSAEITADSATPGYLPGPLQPGTWHVVLGLADVDEPGVDVELTWDVVDEPGEPLEAPPAPARLPRDPGRRWYAGDLHSHTHHSDAPGSLDDLIAAARRRGLDFLAVTDHNTVSHLPYLAACPDDLLLVPGCELTTYCGHMNVWGLDGLPDFRCRTDDDLRAVIDRARARGWLVSPSHPEAAGREGWAFGYDLPIDCLEVWHGPSAERNAGTLAAWEAILRAGRRVVAVGGSDYHCMKEADWLAMPTTWVLADHLTVPAVLEALRQGRIVLGQRGSERLDLAVERDGQRWEVGETVPPGDPVSVRCPPGTRLLTALGEVAPDAPLDLAAHRYVRGELWAGESGWDLIGLTNPIWSA